MSQTRRNETMASAAFHIELFLSSFEYWGVGAHKPAIGSLSSRLHPIQQAFVRIVYGIASLEAKLFQGVKLKARRIVADVRFRWYTGIPIEALKLDIAPRIQLEKSVVFQHR